MSVSFEPVTQLSEIEDLAAMASQIWHEYWPALIGEAQTTYMVENFQSLEAFIRDMNEHAYEYWFLVDDAGNRVGYTGGHVEPSTNRFFISKIYLISDARGKGYTRKTIDFYNALCKNRGLDAMYLTVNKHNDLGIRAYKGTGFEIIDAVETDIGEGFIMDDYIMERPAR